jgi:hypothetical protein
MASCAVNPVETIEDSLMGILAHASVDERHHNNEEPLSRVSCQKTFPLMTFDLTRSASDASGRAHVLRRESSVGRPVVRLANSQIQTKAALTV